MFTWPARHMPLMPEPLPQLPKPAWPDKKWQCLHAWHSHSAEADSAFCLAMSATHGALTALAQKNSDALSQRSTAPVCALMRSHSASLSMSVALSQRFCFSTRSLSAGRCCRHLQAYNLCSRKARPLLPLPARQFSNSPEAT